MTPSDPPVPPPPSPRRFDADRSFPGPSTEPLLLTAPKKRWYARPWVWLLLLVVAAAAGWFWYSRSQTASTTAAAGADGKKGGFKGKGGFGGGGKRGGPFGGNDVMPVGVATAKPCARPTSSRCPAWPRG